MALHRVRGWNIGGSSIVSSAATWRAPMHFLFALTSASPFPLRHPAELYQPARFYLTALRSGHPPSLSFLANHLSSLYGKRPTRGRSMKQGEIDYMQTDRRGRRAWRLRQAVLAFHMLKEPGRHGAHHGAVAATTRTFAGLGLRHRVDQRLLCSPRLPGRRSGHRTRHDRLRCSEQSARYEASQLEFIVSDYESMSFDEPFDCAVFLRLAAPRR